MIEIFGSQAPSGGNQPGPARARHLDRAVQHRLRPDDRDPGADVLSLLPRPASTPTRSTMEQAVRAAGAAPDALRGAARRPIGDARMNFRKPRPEDPEINLIPFIDVLLVILIFLMLSTTYSKFTELPVTLPVADAEQARDRPARDHRRGGRRRPLRGRPASRSTAAASTRWRPSCTAAAGGSQGHDPDHLGRRDRRAPERHQRDGRGAPRRPGRS